MVIYPQGHRMSHQTACTGMDNLALSYLFFHPLFPIFFLLFCVSPSHTGMGGLQHSLPNNNKYLYLASPLVSLRRNEYN